MTLEKLRIFFIIIFISADPILFKMFDLHLQTKKLREISHCLFL